LLLYYPLVVGREVRIVCAPWDPVSPPDPGAALEALAVDPAPGDPRVDAPLPAGSLLSAELLGDRARLRGREGLEDALPHDAAVRAAALDCVLLTLSQFEGIAAVDAGEGLPDDWAAALGGGATRGRGDLLVHPNPTDASAPDRRILLAAGGDVLLGRKVGRLAAERGWDYPLSGMAGILGEADIAFVNNEAALCTGGRPLPGKGIWLRADPDAARALARAGIDVVSIANNHVLDYDGEGFEETLEALESAGVAYVGGGLNLAAARSPVWIEADGLRVGFLAYTDFADIFWSWSYRRTLAATDSRCGVAPLEEAAMVEDVAGAASQADAVVVSLHWGVEGGRMPTDGQRALARSLARAGATVIVGHHPHVLQGVEVVSGVPVLYSLGNLVWDPIREDNARGAVARVVIDGGGAADVELVPVRIEECRAVPATGRDAEEILATLAALSERMGTTFEPSPDGVAMRLAPAAPGR